MRWRVKLLLVALCLILWVVAGLYLSGYILIAMLKLSSFVKIDSHTYINYVTSHVIHHGSLKSSLYAHKIKMAGYIGFFIAFVVSLIPIFLILRPPVKSIHGTARFAGNLELSQKNFFKSTDTSLVVGEKNGHLLYFSGQQFPILSAPTRSGKGVGIVIPNLLNYQGSCVVLDIKQENFDLTSGYRKDILGQDVFLFNPFAEDGRTNNWNPLTYVSTNPEFMVGDLSAIAAMLYPDGSSDQKFWVAQARNAFLALTLFLFEQYSHNKKLFKGYGNVQKPSIGAVFRLASGNGSDLKTFFQELNKSSFLSKTSKVAFSGLISQADETFSSIVGSLKEPLNSWLNPIVDRATSSDDFLLTDVRKKKMTIYIGILPNKLAESRLIVNLFFSQLINMNTKELPQNNRQLKHQCLLLMDEFTSIGKVDIIANAVSYMAGYNIRLFPIIQSIAQLDSVYGKEIARTLITNHALQIIYAPREQRDATDYSEMLGYMTVRKSSVSRGRETSRSESDERRALMLPQELKAMGERKELFLFEGLSSPVLCNKLCYYKDRRFTKKLLPKVVIKSVNMRG